MSDYDVMLDTNIVSAIVSGSERPIKRIEALGPSRVCISVLTAAELRYGVRKKGSRRLEEEIDRVLAALDVLPFAEPADREYGIIRDALTRVGVPIGPVDFFIAAHALALDLMLVTANIREFSRVPGLRVENWLD